MHPRAVVFDRKVVLQKKSILDRRPDIFYSRLQMLNFNWLQIPHTSQMIENINYIPLNLNQMPSLCKPFLVVGIRIEFIIFPM